MDRLAQHGPVALDAFVGGDVVEARKRTDPETAAGERLDPIETGDVGDVHQTVGRGDAEAEPVEQLGAAGEHGGSRLTRRSERVVEAGCAGVRERAHQLGVGQVSEAAAALTASTICG